MRVLHVVTRFGQGGSERDILRQIEWEQDHGFDVEVAIGGAEQAVSPADGVQAHGIASLVPPLHPASDMRAYRALRTLMREREYDIVHTHQSKAGVVGRMAARGAVTAIAHTVHMASFGPGYSPVLSRVQAMAERYCGRFTDVIVCVGDELRSRYLDASIGGPDRYAVMRTPVDIDRFAAARSLDPVACDVRRESFGIPAGIPMVLVVGALEPRKRHAMLVEQLAPLLRAERVIVAIAGEGPERANLEDLIEHLGVSRGVHLLGHTSRVDELLACADILALTSRVEGVPRVLIESLAAGVPVVATDVEGLREVPDAPIRIVSRDGDGLPGAVDGIISRPRPEPVPLELLHPWRPESVDEQIASIYERLTSQIRLAA